MTRTLIAAHGLTKEWWKSAVVYQIYPSSFCDTNGDGTGDLQGVIEKVDYLAELGVDALWLSPIFKSPQVDMGYDVSDYQEIHAPYGTVADVDRLIAHLHQRGMKLLLDLVVNHTSDEHVWFTESRSSKLSLKRDWYIWRPAKYDADGERRPPNNWKAAFGGSVWTWDEASEEYYLHYYDAKQPDLNWDCPEVREAIYEMMRWWLGRGCDGFRMDVIGRISKVNSAYHRLHADSLDEKDHAFPDAPVIDPTVEYQAFPRLQGPRVHEFISEMNSEVLSKYDVLTVGELNYLSPEQMLNFVHPDRKELQMGFCFDHVNIGLTPTERYMVAPWQLSELKGIISRWQEMRELGAWHALYLENHDQPRSVSRFGNDSVKWRYESAKVLAMMHSTLFGTVYLHQGQEIGMKNLPDDWPIEDYLDVQTQGVIKQVRKRGGDVEDQIKRVLFKARDNGRAPMQWSAEANAGFSSAKPWMRMSDDYADCNVAAQSNDPTSVFSFWKTMLKLRKRHEDALVYGTFELLSPGDERVFAYIRARSLLVIMNFSEARVDYKVPVSIKGATLMQTTSASASTQETQEDNTITLNPWSGMVYQL